jgi:uncharacterized protein
LTEEIAVQYLVLGYDGTDEAALERRLASRQAHIALGDQMRDAGKMLFGVAILNESDQMIGSALICDFDNKEELGDWLKREPYVTGKVWQRIETHPCRVGPSFI